MNFTEFIESALDSAFFKAPDWEKGVLNATLSKGDPNARVAVVTGENATGKSFLVGSMLPAWARHELNIQYILVGMKVRTQGDIASAFMYGDEGWESTGVISARAICGALSTCQQRDTEHILLLDEPEIGLSYRYQVAMGKKISDFCQALPDLTFGVVIATHSKVLVNQIKAPFHFIRFGEDRLSLQDWLTATDDDASPNEIDNLVKLGTQGLRDIQTILKN